MNMIKSFLTLSLAVLGTLLAAQPASAAPAISGQFNVDGVPGHITAGPDGNGWFVVSGNSGGNEIGQITPTGTITYFQLDTVLNPVGITAGPSNELWVTNSTGVARVPIGDPTTEVFTPIADITNGQAITLGADGNLWTGSADKIVKVPPAAPATGAAAATVPGMSARDVAYGTDNRVWVVDGPGSRIIAMNADGTFTAHPIGGNNAQGIAAGPGGQVLYSNPGTNPHTVGRLTFGAAALTTDLAPGADPTGVTFGLDGAYWVAQTFNQNLARVTTDGQITTLGPFTAPRDKPRRLAADSGGRIWVSLEDPGNDGAIGIVTGLEAPVVDPDPDPDPTPDTTASIEILGKKIKLKENGSAKVKLACPADEANGPCTGRVKLKSKKLGTVAKGIYNAGAGTIVKAKVKVKSDSELEQLLADEDGTKVKVIATVADALGNGAKATDKQKLKPTG